MTGWLIDTLAWTAALIALVLILRRPVARHLGPQFAYALWALPLLRLVLPPITLPAAFAPQAEPVSEPAVLLAETSILAAAPVDAGAAMEATPIDWWPYAMAIWLAGAGVFLFLRFNGYFTMRRALLEDAIAVGNAGNIRFVETPRATAPLAFGVFDKVVALPPGFMALHDKHSRDLALAHELAHHGGHDLLANFAVQPLFALHWFNPLAWLGWRAMRRDQEAACDARVIATRAPEDRAAYANVIASFAAGPEVSLAAPMACPVLGEKSIIHRLRSLSMSDISPRRRMAGRVLAGAALLALPLTASISYAAPEAPEAPAVPLPPAPPAPPAAPLAPDAPPAPEAPEAPGMEDEFTMIFTGVGEDGDPADAPVDKDVKVWVVKDKDGKETRQVVEKKVVRIGNWDKLSAEERARVEKQLEKLRENGELHREIEMAMTEARRERHGAMAEAHEERRIAMIEMKEGMKNATRIEMRCEGDEPVTETTTRNGQKVIMMCKSKIMASALDGLKEARKEIAQDKDLSDEMRARVLESLDEQIAAWEKKG